ncbi:MAG: hypothetical protein ABFS35_04315, partial [Bacteroidota bacterium]
MKHLLRGLVRTFIALHKQMANIQEFNLFLSRKKRVIIDLVTNISKRLFNYFLVNINTEPFIIQLKAKAFVILNIMGFFVNLLYILIGIFSKISLDYFTHITISLIILTNLILVYRGMYKVAGNFFTISLILLFALSTNIGSIENSFDKF